MKFVAILTEKRKEAWRTDLLKDHVDHLRALKAKGVLVICGPFKGTDGAMQILEAPSRQEAEEHLLRDPFLAERYFSHYDLYEWVEANEGNNYLS